MPNKRAENIKRITITIDGDMLNEVEDASAAKGMDRLEFIRESIEAMLKQAKGDEAESKKSKK